MKVINNKIKGDQGELEVIKLIKCPNCSRKLMLLPNSYPLYDVQCTGCYFRAQVKSASDTRPSDIIRGAGWDIMDKVLKSGALVPPLIVNFTWTQKGKKFKEVRFYPFIKKSCLNKYTANIKSRHRIYKMFNYDLRGMKYYIVYVK